MDKAPLTFRMAERKDAPLILQFIRELARLRKVGAGSGGHGELRWRSGSSTKRKAEVLFALADGKEVGFALFFHNFSTFLGRAGTLSGRPVCACRNTGARATGKGSCASWRQIALERGCGRLEWWCLDWNRPSIDFYLSLGAEPMAEWTVYRVTAQALERLAEEN